MSVGVIATRVWWHRTWRLIIKRQHCCGNAKDKLKQQSTVNNRSTEDNHKILLRIQSIQLSRLLLLFIYMTTHYMPGHVLTQSQYAHQKLIKHFGDLIAQLDKESLTHTSRSVWHFVITSNTDYPVHGSVSTGLLPIEEFSEDWLFLGEI